MKHVKKPNIWLTYESKKTSTCSCHNKTYIIYQQLLELTLSLGH